MDYGLLLFASVLLVAGCMLCCGTYAHGPLEARQIFFVGVHRYLQSTNLIFYFSIFCNYVRLRLRTMTKQPR